MSCHRSGATLAFLGDASMEDALESGAPRTTSMAAAMRATIFLPRRRNPSSAIVSSRRSSRLRSKLSDSIQRTISRATTDEAIGHQQQAEDQVPAGDHDPGRED